MPARCSRGQPIFTPDPSEPTRPTPARDDRRHQDSRTGAARQGRSARSDFGEEEGGQDGQLVWWGDQVTGPSDEPIVMHFHQDGSAHLLDPAEDTERLVRGRVTPDRDRMRVQVNSHRRLTRLLQILADTGAQGGDVSS
jgi:hypothetical protein